MRIAVVGSRNFTDKFMMELVLLDWKQEYGDNLRFVSGGADGADSIAEELAYEWDVPIKVIRPLWSKYGKSAGFQRNKLIVDDCDVLLAFYGPDGETKGTASSVRLAKDAGKEFGVYYQSYKEENQ